MNFRRFSIWSAGAVLAIFVAYASYVIVNQVRAPSARSPSFPWHTATSEANFAYAGFAARRARDPQASVGARELRLAQQAYRVEPLSSAALGLIIVSKEDTSPVGTRRKLLGLAGKLSRRSSLITSASIEAAALEGDQNLFFNWLSRAVLTDSRLRASYVGAMAEATARNGAVEALLPVLGSKPSWAKYYWAAVASRAPSLANAATLRVAVSRPPWKQAEIMDTDYALAWRLVGAGQFDNARQLARMFEKGAPNISPTNNLLVNGNFARQPLLPPLDWALATSGHLGSSIDAKGKRLTISAIAGAFGNAARQLIDLEPGNYRVAWTIEANEAIGDDSLSVNLACAEKGVHKIAIPQMNLAMGTHHQDIVVPTGDCRWYWFSIDAHVPDDSAGFDAFLSKLSLTRLR